MAKRISPSKRSFNNFVGSACHKKNQKLLHRRKSPSKKNVPSNKKRKGQSAMVIHKWLTSWVESCTQKMKQRVIKNCSTWIPCWPSSVGRDYGLLVSGFDPRWEHACTCGGHVHTHWWWEHVCTSDHSWVWSCRHEWCLLCGHVGVNDDSRIRSHLFIKRPKRFADCVSCRWCRRPSWRGGADAGKTKAWTGTAASRKSCRTFGSRRPLGASKKCATWKAASKNFSGSWATPRRRKRCKNKNKKITIAGEFYVTRHVIIHVLGCKTKLTWLVLISDPAACSHKGWAVH